ncbi:MAG: hypothetical protein HY558_06045 [Euryarchaeota archaeon]|nr:hypothetical protein [Euryarchaeota archaeon]
MSFLIDVPLLFVAGVLINYVSVRFLMGRLGPGPTHDHIVLYLCGAVLVVFYLFSISLFLDLPWVEPMWRMLGARSGIDWQVNSGVFHFNAVWPPGREMVGVAILAFVSYPFSLWLGAQAGIILYGAHEGQTGMVGLLWFEKDPRTLPPPPGFSPSGQAGEKKP